MRSRLIKKLYLTAYAVMARAVNLAVDLLERIPCRDLGHEPEDYPALVAGQRCLRCGALLTWDEAAKTWTALRTKEVTRG